MNAAPATSRSRAAPPWAYARHLHPEPVHWPPLQMLRLDQRSHRLFAAGAAGVAVYRLLSGIVRLERVSSHGACCIVRLAGPGDLVGLEAALGHPYGTDAHVCDTAEISVMPRAAFDARCQQDPAMRLELQVQWQRALHATEEWQAEMLRGTARHRLLHLLRKLDDLAGASGLAWLPTRREIGNMLDMALETASRQLTWCRQEGLLDIVDAHHVRVCRPRLLAALRAA